MAGFARLIGAFVVAIALIAAQIMPAWAGCHSQRHAAAMTHIVKSDPSGHHGMSHAVLLPDIALTSSDQPTPSTSDVCLGNCGCACGLGGAFVLATTAAIDAPLAVTLDPEFTSSNLPLGNRPDGPHRPPRTIA